MTRRKIENPPNWHFPISYREMRKKRMRNMEKALRKIGMTKKELNKKYKKYERVNNKKTKKRRRRNSG